MKKMNDGFELLPQNKAAFNYGNLPQEFNEYRVTTDQMKTRPKRVQQFYMNQNQQIDAFIGHYNKYSEVAGHEEDNQGDNGEKRAHGQLAISIAINGSFALNLFLLLVKVIAAVLSGSMAVVASVADSLLDILSGLVMYLMQRSMDKFDPYEYPEGKARIEPIGIIVFACVMGISSLQIIIEAIKRIAIGTEGEPPELSLDAISGTILAFTIISKLLLYFYCHFVSKHYKSMASSAYAQDHRNDVLTNSVGIFALYLSVQFPDFWFLDSSGAIVLASWIIYNWTATGLEQIDHLAGKSASPEFLSELTFIAFNHSKLIKQIDTVRAYHFGSKFLVEMDIVLPEDMLLKEAHDLGESLQNKLESLELVQRAFVHIDYETAHKPEHSRKWGE